MKSFRELSEGDTVPSLMSYIPAPTTVRRRMHKIRGSLVQQELERTGTISPHIPSWDHYRRREKRAAASTTAYIPLVSSGLQPGRGEAADGQRVNEPLIELVYRAAALANAKVTQAAKLVSRIERLAEAPPTPGGRGPSATSAQCAALLRELAAEAVEGMMLVAAEGDHRAASESERADAGGTDFVKQLFGSTAVLEDAPVPQLPPLTAPRSLLFEFESRDLGPLLESPSDGSGATPTSAAGVASRERGDAAPNPPARDTAAFARGQEPASVRWGQEGPAAAASASGDDGGGASDDGGGGSASSDGGGGGGGGADGRGKSSSPSRSAAALAEINKMEEFGGPPPPVVAWPTPAWAEAPAPAAAEGPAGPGPSPQRPARVRARPHSAAVTRGGRVHALEPVPEADADGGGVGGHGEEEGEGGARRPERPPGHAHVRPASAHVGRRRTRGPPRVLGQSVEQQAAVRA